MLGPTSGTAVVTLAIGRGFAARWHSLGEPLWRRYCERHGYDLICLEEPLDDSVRARSRSPAWQKCLVLGQPFAHRYRQIVWVDADVLPNPGAPPVGEGVPPELVGAVDEYATPTPELHRRTLAKLYDFWEATGVPFIRNETPREYYRVYGLPDAFDAVVQTGVMVLSPSHHRELLEDVYASYEDKGTGWNYEMRPLSYELLRARCVTWLDPRFNTIWGSHKALHFPFLLNRPDDPRAPELVARALRDTYFLHFAGSVDEMAAAGAKPAPAERPAARTGVRRRGPVLHTPVVLFVHARPDTTKRLVEIVRDARPAQVLVVADGPRPGRADEAERCAAARAVVEQVDWRCEVLTNYADGNLGLKRRIETGLDWAFQQVGEAILLEDDCLPHPSFFPFCEEMLERFRDTPRILSVSGNNFDPRADRGRDDYRFSLYPHIWGWATWQRAWQHHDPEMSRWPELRDSGWLDRVLGDRDAVQYWTYTFERTYRQGHTWDYAWVFASWLADGLSVVPSRNLVTNVGFRDDATNTRAEYRGVFADVPAVEIDFPLRHPASVERDAAADAFVEDVMFSGNVSRLFERIRARRPEPSATRPG